jgi:low affinity Fe/Cu permease
MKHVHLKVNTALTLVIFLLVCFLLYTSTIKQDAKIDTKYNDLLELFDRQQTILRIQQENLKALERQVYNYIVSTPTMGEIILNISEVK